MSMKQYRNSRSDGDNTKIQIMETAGKLIAEYGYDRTTSKDICQHAKVNMAAINYHFGSREGLYLEILHYVHKQLVNISTLQELVDSAQKPEDKLRTLLRIVSSQIKNSQNWYLRIWLREMFFPSSILEKITQQNINLKMSLFSEIIMQITGLPDNSPKLMQVILNIISPFIGLLLIGQNHSHPLHSILQIESEQFADNLWDFSMAGLNSVSI